MCRLRRAGARRHHLGQVGDGAELRLQGVLLLPVQLEPLPPPEQRAVLKHLNGFRMKSPVGTLARPIWPPGNLDEAVIEAEIVSERVLPPLRVLPVVGERVHDELVDLGEGQHPLRGAE